MQLLSWAIILFWSPRISSFLGPVSQNGLKIVCNKVNSIRHRLEVPSQGRKNLNLYLHGQTLNHEQNFNNKRCLDESCYKCTSFIRTQLFNARQRIPYLKEYQPRWHCKVLLVSEQYLQPPFVQSCLRDGTLELVQKWIVGVTFQWSGELRYRSCSCTYTK